MLPNAGAQPSLNPVKEASAHHCLRQNCTCKGERKKTEREQNTQCPFRSPGTHAPGMACHSIRQNRSRSRSCKKNWPRSFWHKVVSISQPRWPGPLRSRELSPDGKPRTWHCLNHGHSRPLDRLAFPFEGQEEARAWERLLLVDRHGMALLVLKVLQRLSTDQVGPGQTKAKEGRWGFPDL